jgi:hypothetical protein
MLSAGESDVDPITLPNRIRNYGELSSKEQAYVDKWMSKKNLTREEIAQHLENTYDKSEQIEHERKLAEITGQDPFHSPAAKKTNAVSPVISRLKNIASPLVVICGVIGVFVGLIVFIRALIIRHQEINRLQYRSSGELLAQTRNPDNPEDIDDTPPGL